MSQPTDKATPRPWRIERRPDDYAGDDEDATGCDATPNAVDISGPTSREWGKFAHVFVRCQGQPDDEGEANAALIVRAVNEREALLSLLRETRAALGQCAKELGVGYFNAICDRVDAALKLAETPT